MVTSREGSVNKQFFLDNPAEPPAEHAGQHNSAEAGQRIVPAASHQSRAARRSGDAGFDVVGRKYNSVTNGSSCK